MKTKDPALSKTRMSKDDDHIAKNEIAQETIVNTEHINAGDNPTNQPDRRDQKGNPFDDNINEYNVLGDIQKSAGITNTNRYATVDNAQTRVLNPDERI